MENYRLTKIIEKKRDGKALLDGEISYFVEAVTRMSRDPTDPNAAHPSQIGAMLMAIYLNGLNDEETICLTEKMRDSGYVFEWPDKISGLVVDKHSTGGVGDKVSLVLAPILASLGFKVPMISGRSLGHTGGTLDKLESIPGFRVHLSTEEIYNIINDVGCCIVGQTENCVPADKILYKTRELTGTVQCFSLIISSIVSKKLSESPRGLIYDVKYGKGAFFSKAEACKLASTLVRISTSRATDCSAILTSMENPLGRTIGNALEVSEAVETLKGKGPEDLHAVVAKLGKELLRLVHDATRDEGEAMMEGVIKDGRALQTFYRMLIHQGVSKRDATNLCYGEKESVLPKARYRSDLLYSGAEGFVDAIDPLVLAMFLKDELFKSHNHPGVGFELHKIVGDRIKPDDPWVRVWCESAELSSEGKECLQKAITVTPEKRDQEVADSTVVYSSKK